MNAGYIGVQYFMQTAVRDRLHQKTKQTTWYLGNDEGGKHKSYFVINTNSNFEFLLMT